MTLGVFATHSRAADEKKPAPARPALTVTTVRPESLQLPITLTAQGSVAAWQEAVIGSEVGGLRLAEVRANVGDRVGAGQVVAVLADEAVRNDLAQAQASLAEAEAAAADAAGNAERARGLTDTGALSQQQINQYATTAQTAQARVLAARAAVATQQLRLRQTRVTAPDAGLISARSATVGAVVASGTELFKLIRQGRLEWRAEVTAGELARLAVGTPARVTVASGVVLPGRVRAIAPSVDPQNRIALVYVDLPARAGVQAGMFARGEFELGQSAALTLPQQAVVVRDGFSHAFRVGAEGRVVQVKVETGRRQGSRVEVLSGLAPDAVVVAAGAGFLNDGDLVKIAPAAAPAEAASAPASARR